MGIGAAIGGTAGGVAGTAIGKGISLIAKNGVNDIKFENSEEDKKEWINL